MKKALYPGSEYVEYTYDNNGNRLTMVDTRLDIEDETFTWEYDDLNRVTKEIYPNDEPNRGQTLFGEKPLKKGLTPAFSNQISRS